MEVNVEANPEVIAEFTKRRNRQLIAVVPFLLAFFPLLMLEENGEDVLFGIPITVMVPVCIAVLIVMFIFSFLNWKCPACNSYLGKGINPKFCQKCGVRLQHQ